MICSLLTCDGVVSARSRAGYRLLRHHRLVDSADDSAQRLAEIAASWMSARVSDLSTTVTPQIRVGGVPVKRDRAVELVEHVLARLEAGWDQWPVNLLA